MKRPRQRYERVVRLRVRVPVSVKADLVQIRRGGGDFDTRATQVLVRLARQIRREWAQMTRAAAALE